MALLDWSEATRKLDRLLHDGLVRINQRAAPAEVVIASIDTASLARFGRWPWSRDLQASVFAELARLAPRAVIVDIVYAEAADRAGADAQLAEVIDALPLVVLPVLLEGGGANVAGSASYERLPVAPLLGAADALGHIALPIDDDGIVRRVRLKAGFGRAHWSALPLAALELIEPDRFASAASPLPGRKVAPPPDAPSRRGWVENHEALIPYYGPSGHFPRIPVIDLLAGAVDREAMAGRIVLLGLTATGLGDVVPSPVSAQDRPLAGVEVHANVLAALLEGRLVTPAPAPLSLVVAALLLSLVLLAYSLAPPQWSLAIALTGAVLPVLLGGVLYIERGVWYAPVSASLAVLASYLVWSRHRLSFVNRFLEAEHARLGPHLPRREERENPRLARFFEQAVRHLPIDAWRIEAGDEHHAGSVALPTLPLERQAGDWRQHGAIWSKRFDTRDRLTITLRISAPARAHEVLEYIDSLARIRSRIRGTSAGGSLERLQRNATRLSSEMAWLRGVKEFSETLLAGSPVGFAVWSPAGELVRRNALVHRLLPRLPARVPLLDFLHAIGQDPSEPGMRERLDALLERGDPWQITCEVGKVELVVDFSAAGERLADRLICASLVDVSAVRSVERARAELVDYLSHDLRSPLISALYRLESGSVGAPHEASPDDPVADSIRKSLSMMDALLHVARADGLDPVDFHEVLLDDVIDNALDLLQPQAHARGILLRGPEALSGRQDQPPVWVAGDAVSLERVVVNLLGNAIKYSFPGGEVRVMLGITASGEEAELTVSDDGQGIDPSVIGSLFQRFRRDPRTERSHAGIGLGLALVSRVVAQHAGRISATSLPDRGTDIVLHLPVLAQEEGATRSA